MADNEIFELGIKDKDSRKGVVENAEAKVYGPYMCIGPTDAPGIEEVQNRYSKLNFTGQPGTASAIYFSLVFNLPKTGWRVEKADEFIEVSPTHKEYYERTNATKQMLESTIKTGLASASQAVADFELMDHDIRKYKEILTYFQSKDERLLRSMFIDQVDVHTDLPGQPIALRTIVSRWPTIIADFMGLTDDDIDPDVMITKYDFSKAEAVILSTKNKLFRQWKDMFKDTAKDRYIRLKGLVTSRKKTIKEYKEWLKPYIARFKMTKLGTESSFGRSATLKSFADITGMFTFFNVIRLFIWKPMKITEHQKPFREVTKKGGFVLDPYDDYVRDEIILNKKTGLVAIYPWLAKPWMQCSKCGKYFPEGTEKCKTKDCKGGSKHMKSKFFVDKVVREEIIPKWNMERNLDPSELYYVFVDMTIERAGSRLQIGELEDITFTSKVFAISQNIMLTKILELWCRDRELENYIDEMLGMRFEDSDIEDIVKGEFPGLYGEEKEDKEKEDKKKKKDEKKKKDSDFEKFMKDFKKKYMFLKKGPYEADMKDRITKHYLKFVAIQLAGITNFLKAKMGVE
jgi:hypothetical protein